MRLHQLFQRWRAERGTQVFLHLPGQALDFESVGRQVDALEQEMTAAGVRPGDRVLIVAENCPEHVALILACSQVGAWSCGVNARMAPGEVAAFAAKADARLIYFTAAVSPAAARHAERHLAGASVLPGLRRSGVRVEAVAETGTLGSTVAAIIFTSGTTGAPKGVMLTHDGLTHFGRISAESRQLNGADRSYAYLPMTHIFGLGTVLAASLHAGASLVMRPQFDAADVVQALAHGRVTQLQGPPTLFSRLLSHFDEAGIDHPACPDLRYLYTGAGPLDMSLKTQVEQRFGQPLHHGYGLSEYAGSVYVTALGEHRADTSAGLRVEGAELRIVGPDGQDLPALQRGEIWLRGRGLTAGYFRDAAANAEAFKPGGWYASGDLGYLGEDGALFVVGRLKEMVIRSGFNVYPAEVEASLHAFPAIRSAAVLGRPEAHGNEALIAFVLLRDDGAALDRAALDAHLRETLAPYKRPSEVHVMRQFPMTHSGKVIKRELLAQLRKEGNHASP